MRAVFKSTQGVVRFYEKGKDYEHRDPYVGVANVLFIDDVTVAIVGMCGTISKDGLKSLLQELRQLGVSTVLAERNGRKVTYHLEDY